MDTALKETTGTQAQTELIGCISIKNKRAIGRHKDLADLELLGEIIE